MCAFHNAESDSSLTLSAGAEDVNKDVKYAKIQHSVLFAKMDLF